jgi:PAS domain S-box-containing protein
VAAKFVGSPLAGEKAFYRLNIGPRLTIGFGIIVLAMLIANAVLLWQLHQGRAQAERLSGVDQELIGVLQAHVDLMSFYERLDLLAQSRNAALLVNEAQALRNALIVDRQHSADVFSHLPPEVRLDPTLLPTLEAIQEALPAQLEAVVDLAKSNEWEAVRLRLANQVRPLESTSSALVENISRQVAEERAQAVFNIHEAQRRVLLTVPITGALTILFAAFLGWAITRSITQPLTRLMEGSAALGSGDFSHRVPAAGNDEISRLGNVFNNMAVKLQELYRELQRRETYLAEAQKLSHTGSFGVDASTGKIYWSQETYRIFEYDPATEPTVEMVLQRSHPADRQLVKERITRASTEGAVMDFEHRLLMHDGSIKYLRVVGRTKREEGEAQFIGAVTDITERKVAEEALRQTQATLAHVTRVTTLGELTASIAHEINQPLAAAITDSSTCLLWLERDPPDLEEAREAALRSVKDATRAADIISRIRTLFKRGTSQREPVDINEVIREMTVLLHDEADRYSVSIHSNLAADLPTVIADRVQLQQVLMNLMRNGIEVMKSTNGGELIVKSELRDDGDLLISVSDTGLGLAPQQAERIFDAFFTTKPEGTGMGLTISRSIIESHSGRLWATANSGRGTTFLFTLPRESEVTNS